MSKLIVIGVGPDGPTPAGQAALATARYVVTAARHRTLVAGLDCEVAPITPLAQALPRIEENLAHGDVAVLASGDPLFFGIARRLSDRFGSERLIVHPALSSMQLAFARLKEPWEEAIFISLHGRMPQKFPSTPLRERAAQSPFPERSRRELFSGQDLISALLSGRPVFLFTDPQQRPEIIAADLARRFPELGLADSDCRIMVAEELGGANERITHGTPAAIAGQRFADLNVMICRLTAPPPAAAAFTLGLTAAEIAHSRGLITKDEVRAAILHRLRLPHTGVLWDIGAGSGSIAIEAARLCPGLTVYAVERNPAEQANIAANRKTFRLANLHLIPGAAPEALVDLPDPNRIVIGGSGGHLPTIVEAACSRLAPHGIVVASAVTAATRESAPRLFHHHGLRVELMTIAVTRESYPAASDGPLALNPITIITGST